MSCSFVAEFRSTTSCLVEPFIVSLDFAGFFSSGVLAGAWAKPNTAISSVMHARPAMLDSNLLFMCFPPGVSKTTPKNQGYLQWRQGIHVDMRILPPQANQPGRGVQK